jgi:hypothetical protein
MQSSKGHCFNFGNTKPQSEGVAALDRQIFDSFRTQAVFLTICHCPIKTLDLNYMPKPDHLSHGPMIAHSQNRSQRYSLLFGVACLNLHHNLFLTKKRTILTQCSNENPIAHTAKAYLFVRASWTPHDGDLENCFRPGSIKVLLTSNKNEDEIYIYACHIQERWYDVEPNPVSVGVGQPLWSNRIV